MVPESTIGRRRPLKVAIAGGGSGGHVSPAVAIVQELRERTPVDVFWIGSKPEFEGTAARDLGIPFHRIRAGKLRRYLSLSTFADTFRVPIGIVEARRILQRERPDIVVSTGGFVSVPSVIAGSRLGIPVITHEQTAHIGLATRINSRFCDTIALSFERSRSALPSTSARVVVTGNPVRESILCGDADGALRFFGLPGTRPLMYVTGGAQGARAINRVVGDAAAELLHSVEIIHQCGPRTVHDDYDHLMEVARQLPPELARGYRVCERIGPELGDLYAATRLVVGRAGAGTVAELAAAGLPSILIPLPGAEEQRQNALYLGDAGAAIVVSQSDLKPQRLIDLVTELVNDVDRLDSMASAARSAAADDPTGRLVDEILRLADSGRD